MLTWFKVNETIVIIKASKLLRRNITDYPYRKGRVSNIPQ